MLSLGIDGGASSAKWVVIDQSQTVITRGVSAAIDGHLYRRESLDRFNDCLSEIKKSIGDSKIGAVTIGITEQVPPTSRGNLLFVSCYVNRN